MKEKYNDREGMEWIVGDLSHMESLFSENQFDFILDKGTLDSIMFRVRHKLRYIYCEEVIQELTRVLKVGGTICGISSRVQYVKSSLRDKAYWTKEARLVIEPPKEGFCIVATFILALR